VPSRPGLDRWEKRWRCERDEIDYGSKYLRNPFLRSCRCSPCTHLKQKFIERDGYSFLVSMTKTISTAQSCVFSSSHFSKDVGVEGSTEDSRRSDLPLPLHGFLRSTLWLGKWNSLLEKIRYADFIKLSKRSSKRSRQRSKRVENKFDPALIFQSQREPSEAIGRGQC